MSDETLCIAGILLVLAAIFGGILWMLVNFFGALGILLWAGFLGASAWVVR